MMGRVAPRRYVGFRHGYGRVDRKVRWRDHCADVGPGSQIELGLFREAAQDAARGLLAVSMRTQASLAAFEPGP